MDLYFPKFLNNGLLTTASETLWTPLNLPLTAWYDAADAATILEAVATGRVSQWSDKSGNGHHLLSTIAASQPITGSQTLNGLNVITGLGNAAESVLDPVGNQTGSIPGLDSENFEIHVVYQTIAGQNTEAQVGLRATFGGDIISGSWRNGGPLGPRSGTNYWFTNGAEEFPSGTPYLLGYSLDATNAFMRKDGAVIDSLEPMAGPSAAFNRFMLMCRGGGSNKYHGYMAEVIVTTRLSDADRLRLEGYLMTKWGI